MQEEKSTPEPEVSVPVAPEQSILDSSVQETKDTSIPNDMFYALPVPEFKVRTLLKTLGGRLFKFDDMVFKVVYTNTNRFTCQLVNDIQK